MAESTILDRPPLSAWQMESLRATIFLSPAAQIAAEPSWWSDLVGESSETQVTQRKQGIRQEEGPFEKGRLILTIRTSRVDWLYRGVDESGSDREGPWTIGSFPESSNTFSQLMTRWFRSGGCPSAQRLAFGAVLLQPVDDQRTSYRRLATYLPSLQLTLEGATDFSYQINRARNSCLAIPGLRINRVSKWATVSWTVAEFPSIEARPRVQQKGTGCRLELDINTHPDFSGDLPQEQLPRIFEELVAFGQEIATEGDIP